MFKLLTEEEKQKVAREYFIRRMVVTLFGLILVLVVGIIGLSPSYVLSSAREHEALERVRIMGTAGLKGDEAGLQVWLGETSQRLATLSPKLDVDRPSDFIAKVLDQRIAGVRITGFSWLKEKDKITLSVNGVASNRQTLVAFENQIDASGHFSNVTLPISDLAKDRNINFQIKFSPL